VRTLTRSLTGKPTEASLNGVWARREIQHKDNNVRFPQPGIGAEEVASNKTKILLITARREPPCDDYIKVERGEKLEGEHGEERTRCP